MEPADNTAAPTSLNSKQFLNNQQANGSPLEQKRKYPKFLDGASHPGFCILHLSFKAAAFLCYILLGLFVSGKSIVFIVVAILSAFDFWVVKNLTGR